MKNIYCHIGEIDPFLSNTSNNAYRYIFIVQKTNSSADNFKVQEWVRAKNSFNTKLHSV